MRLVLLSLLTMTAFAANSVLNRLALAPGEMDPILFAALRLASGAGALGLMVVVRQGGAAFKKAFSPCGVASLLAYIFGFSLAYGVLDPGFGALILFAVVQITMFAGAVISRDRIPVARWIGAGLALGGLVWLLWPGQGVTVAVAPVLAMALAGVGWGVYSLLGRGARDPLSATAANFLFASPVALLLCWGAGQWSAPLGGILLAILSGVVTSGLGYALWYRILPDLGASRAAVAQLSVPVIALAGGMVFLGEALTLRFTLAAALVILGVLISLRKA
ncbi:DMT family transporter [Shimia sp.]|uniref:DMT family transporter n=1 Tax=Shimia sp. TaxID=1954381 RepID=UPI003565D49B